MTGVNNVKATDRRRRYGVMGRNLALNIESRGYTVSILTAPVRRRKK